MRSFLRDACNQLSIQLTDEQIEQFFVYKELLLDWNEKINLTTIVAEQDVLIKHFVDSMSIACFLDVSGKKIIDVGTGAGFPGLPLKLLHHDIDLVLLDSLHKRVRFLEDVVDKLQLPEVRCVHMRAEEGGRDEAYREQFDISLSRAVANLASLAEYCLPYVCVGGTFVAMKGPDVGEEMKEAQNAIGLLGGEISDMKTVHLPSSDIQHSIIFVKKIRQTPPKYPRAAHKVSKSPLK